MKEIVIICSTVSTQSNVLTQEELLKLRTEKLLKDLNQTSLEVEKKILEIVNVISSC